MNDTELPMWNPDISKDYNNGFEDGRKFAEVCMFKSYYYRLAVKDSDIDDCDEITFETADGAFVRFKKCDGTN